MGFWLAIQPNAALQKAIKAVCSHVFKSERFLVQRVDFDAPSFAGLGV
jgi:hypothetical protein